MFLKNNKLNTEIHENIVLDNFFGSFRDDLKNLKGTDMNKIHFDCNDEKGIWNCQQF